MTPEFLVEILGDRELADQVTQVLLIILIVIVPLGLPLVVRIIGRTLKSLFHRLVENELGDQIIDSFFAPLQFIITIASVWAGLSILTVDLDYKIPQRFLDTTASVLITLGIFWAMFRSVDVVADYARRFADDSNNLLTRNMLRFGNQLAEAIVILIGFVVVMGELGYDLNGLMAGLGLTGLAVALAAQETLANLIGYFAIMADAPFRVSEYIEIKGRSGTVENIGFRSTRLRLLDQSQVIIPNRTVANETITNWSRLHKRRFEITLGLKYDTSADKIRTITKALRDLLESHERIIHDGSEFVQFVDFGETSLDLLILGYFDIADWEQFQAAKQDLQLDFIEILEKNGVERALPTQSYVINPALDPSVQIPPPVEPSEGEA